MMRAFADYGMPRPEPHTVESGDITMIRTAARHLPPVAANDNQVGERPKIVGLIGYGGAGKTTFANILRERHRFEGPHIKAPLVSMLRSLLEDVGIRPSMISRYLDGDLKREVIPELGRSGTELQQFLGTEFGRDFCRDDLWLTCWLRAADKIILTAGGRVVQESVRFRNEADAIRFRGGTIVEIRRNGVGPLPGGHKSEVLPCDPDVVIHNDGTVGDLRLQADILAA